MTSFGSMTASALTGGAVFLLISVASPAHTGPHTDGNDAHDFYQANILHGDELKRQNLPGSLQDPSLAAQVARHYILTARNTADPGYYQKARRVLAPWWEAEQPPAELRLMRATLLQHEHHYARATEDLLEVIRERPRDKQAWLTLSSIQIVQGDYRHGLASCAALSRVASVWLSSLCYSQIYSVTGRVEKSLAMQKTLLQKLGGEQNSLRLWLISLMADNAVRLGSTNEADRYFRQALKLKPNDPYTLRGYSDLLLQQQRTAEVITLLEQHRENSALLLRLAQAAKRTGHTATVDEAVLVLKTRFAKARKQGHIHERDEALFSLELLENTEKALRLAQLNWQKQKEPDDAVLLLRAAIAHKAPDAAQPVITWIAKNRLEDVRLEKLMKSLSSS